MDRFSNDGFFYAHPYTPRAGEEPGSQYDSIPFPHQQARDSAPHTQPWDTPQHTTAVLDGWDPDDELAAMLSPAPNQQPAPDPWTGRSTGATGGACSKSRTSWPDGASATPPS